MHHSVNTLLEAGSCGTYVLADSKLSGLSEIIQPKVNGEILNIESMKTSPDKFWNHCIVINPLN